jgi:RNA polymerase sigma-70 factor, ECF subfamily
MKWVAPALQRGGAVLRLPMTVEELYQRHADLVWRTLRRFGVREADAADAVQDVFLTVHRSLDQFEGRSAVTTWLYMICRSVARDRRRRAHVIHEVADDDAIARRADGRADSAQKLELGERLRLLEAALDAMPETQREVFVLFELEGLSGEEIGQVTETAVPTVFSRLRLARTAFQDFVARFDARERTLLARRGAMQ